MSAAHLTLERRCQEYLACHSHVLEVALDTYVEQMDEVAEECAKDGKDRMARIFREAAGRGQKALDALRELAGEEEL